MTSDDRWEVDDEANANGARPYLDDRRAGEVRPARRQPARPGLVTADEIEAFIKREYPETAKPKKKLLRPEGWDELGSEKPAVEARVREPGEDEEELQAEPDGSE